MPSESSIERVERLIAELLELIPQYTSGRGSFSTVPPRYRARNPGDWQREFLEVLDGQRLRALRPDTGDIVGLIHFENFLTLNGLSAPVYESMNGSVRVIPTSTLSSVLGYALFEMLIRKLWRGTRGRSSLEALLKRFEGACSISELSEDLRSLNAQMKSKERGEELNLYKRLKRGRDLLLHGNVLRMTEPEGFLLVLLIDLVVLHIMRSALRTTEA